MANNEDISKIIGDLAKTTVEDDSTVISFAGKSLKWDKASDVTDVVDAIINCPKMFVLKLEGNTMGVDAAKEIAKALEGHPELKRALWKDMFTGRLKTEIPQALRFLSSGLQLAGAQLLELDLSDNAFGPIGVEGIAELLKSPTCYTLQELRLNNNGLGIQGGKVLAQSLLACHKNSSAAQKTIQLRVFICGRNRLENEGAKAIAEVFKLYRSLEEIQMPQNGIFFEGIEAIATALAENPKLKHINFNDNIFTVEGAKAMEKTLPKLQNLEVINLGDCLIKTEGATLLASALKSHNKLKEVHLGYNEIGQRGALDVVKVLGTKSMLEKLELDGNSFGGEGCETIKNALKTLGKLDILGSLSEDEGDDEDSDADVKDEDSDVGSEEKDQDESVTEVERDQSSVPTVIPYTPAEFLSCPSIGRFLGLGDSRIQDLLDHIENVSSGIEYDIDTFIKISSFVKADNQKLKDSAFACCDEILSKTFRKAEDIDNIPTLSNCILVHLGLIKSEDKNIEPPEDLSGPFLVLERCIRQPYFAKSTIEILKVFLSRYQESVEKTGDIKHKFMQTLYRY
ncbi:hypothetical protein CHUAL_009158 [Chamberlinius hualienensis]